MNPMLNMDEFLYWYRAKFLRAVDGDTVDLDWDLGRGTVCPNVRFRLYGVNTPEKQKETMEAGRAAHAFVIRLLMDTTEKDLLRIRTYKDKKDNFGRYLVDLWAPIGYGPKVDLDGRLLPMKDWYRTARVDTTQPYVNINGLLIMAGHGVAYYP